MGQLLQPGATAGPSDLPWAVKIDHPPACPTTRGRTFHPTFLYESLASLAVFGILIWFIRRYWRDVPAGTVFALYATLYSFERIWVETLRIDPAHHYYGQRLNVWVASAVTIVAGVIFVVLFRRRGAGTASPAPVVAPAATGPVHTPTAKPEAATAARLSDQAPQEVAGPTRRAARRAILPRERYGRPC